MVVVDGYKLVLFWDKSEAERARKPKLSFFTLKQTQIIVFLVSNEVIFLGLRLFVELKWTTGAVAKSDCFEEFIHLSLLHWVGLLANFFKIFVYEHFVFPHLVWDVVDRLPSFFIRFDRVRVLQVVFILLSCLLHLDVLFSWIATVAKLNCHNLVAQVAEQATEG